MERELTKAIRPTTEQLGISVFKYRDYRQYLNDVLMAKKHLSNGSSLRVWSKRFGLGSPSYLTMILQNQRKLPSRAISLVIGALKLKASEGKFFETLVFFNHAKSVEERLIYEQRLRKLDTTQSFYSLDLEAFRLVADPLHFILIEMLSLKDFSDDPVWISKRLNYAYSKSQIESAFERLRKLSLIKSDGRGGWVRAQANVTTTNDTPNEALKQFHRVNIQKALVAMDEQPTLERDITSLTLTIKKEDVVEAKKLIKEFRHQFLSVLEAKVGDGDETYQLNIQFFKHT